MNTPEPDKLIEAPTMVTTQAGLEAENYIAKELIRTRKTLRNTQIASVVFVLLTVISIGGITTGFARSLEPNEAATIAKGLVDEHVNDQIPEFKRYIKEKVPVLIAQVPSYVKNQLPTYRTNLESQLESNLDKYAAQSSQQFEGKFDTFLSSNQSGVKALLTSAQDPEAMKSLDLNLKSMFVDYLNNTQVNGTTLQSEIDQSLAGLTEIDTRMKKLAANKDLTDEEKKTRRAIAILLKSVDTNPNIAQAASAVSNLRQNGPGQVQKAVQGVLQYTNSGEATFVEPGKPPVTFILKKGQPTASTPAAPPTAPAAPSKVTAPAPSASAKAPVALPSKSPAAPPVATKTK